VAGAAASRLEWAMQAYMRVKPGKGQILSSEAADADADLRRASEGGAG
jgi:hypothetical protein